MSIYFRKLKANKITGLIFALLTVVMILFITEKIQVFDIVMASVFAILSLLYFNYHKIMYLRYDDKSIYLYMGLFRKLMAVRLEGIRLITVLGRKVRILTKDGKELIVNLSLMNKMDSDRLTSFLKQNIPVEKWV